MILFSPFGVIFTLKGRGQGHFVTSTISVITWPILAVETGLISLTQLIMTNRVQNWYCIMSLFNPSIKIVFNVYTQISLSMVGFYRTSYLSFHGRIWRTKLQQNGTHSVECRTCLHTCKLWADSVARASRILMAAVHRSVLPIHAPMVLVLPRIRRLSQAVGMPCAPERLLVGCGIWSHCL